jgi:hypothetical protein
MNSILVVDLWDRSPVWLPAEPTSHENHPALELVSTEYTSSTCGIVELPSDAC